MKSQRIIEMAVINIDWATSYGISIILLNPDNNPMKKVLIFIFILQLENWSMGML